MKNAVLLACILFGSVTAFGQDDNAILSQGDIGLRGGVQFSSTDNSAGTTTSDFTICAGGLYSVNPRLAVGLMVENSMSNSEYEDPIDPNFNSSDSWSVTHVGPSARYYHPCGPNFNTYVGADVMFGFGSRESDFSGSTSETDISTLGVGLNFGFLWMLSPKVGIEADFGGLSYTSETFGDGDPQTGLDFEVFSKNTSIGFQYFINRE